MYRSTRGAPNCCSRSSPNAKSAPHRDRHEPAVQRTGSLFPDARLVPAIVDRVTFNAHILETGTRSYRLATSKTSSRKRAS